MNKYVMCAMCKECTGAGYQAPPMLYTGGSNAPILVIAQNPGEIRDNDHFRLYQAKAIAEYVEQNGENSNLEMLKLWSDWDFGTSYGARVLAQIFGSDWLANGQFAYTNAVRCRTVGNERPRREMIEKCYSLHTAYLLQKRKGVILLGTLAAQQIFGPSTRLRYFEVRFIDGIYYLLMPHYSRWKNDDLENARASAKTVMELCCDEEAIECIK